MVMRTRRMSIVFLAFIPSLFSFLFLLLSSPRLFSPDTLIPCYCPFLIVILIILIILIIIILNLFVIIRHSIYINLY